MIENLPINEKNFSSEIIEELKELLGEKYDYATSVVTYAEVQSLEFNYTGMAEFRDALTHIKRAIYEESEKNALGEINSASEHIRRAAVESMQEYVESRYVNFRRNLYIPSSYWLKRNRSEINELEMKLKDCIRLGREVKPSKKWRESISYFKQAEDILEQLEKEVPSINERLERIKFLIFLTIALLTGYLIGIIGLWT